MIVSAAEFNEWDLRQIPAQKRRQGNPGRKNSKWQYKDIITAFDIETTRIPDIEQSVMYVWQWQFGDDITVVGRSWDEFIGLCMRIRPHMQGQKLLVFVHNLSYEFQFLRGVYAFGPDDVFAVKPRKILKCEMFGFIEMRCSYLHSNMSLDEYLQKMGVVHRKLTMDYDKPRFPWTELTPDELAYCVNDVQGLVEALKIDMQLEGDNFYTFPLTSTGYVRRDAKEAMRRVSPTYIPGLLPDLHIYTMLREAFRGGNTHANRYYAGKVVRDVHSADRSSSYPDVQVNCEFPVSRFFEAGALSFDEVLDLINRRHKAVLMRVAIYDLRLKDETWGCPYIPKSKTRYGKGLRIDNGRVLSADYLEITITDIDLEIMLSEYDFDAVPLDVAHARYGKLPPALVEVTKRYYKNKTELKGVPGQEVFYTKEKNKLNSIYGMSAQDPVKDRILFKDLDASDQGGYVQEGKDPAELLEENNKHAFLSYAWGVWVTAWARLRLEEGIRLASSQPWGDGFVYCDTDSVKYVGDIDWTAYNADRERDSRASGAYATDPKGVTHYMGVYEVEDTADKFVTWGAKKYLCDYGGTLKATIAGVNKSMAGAELARHGGVDAFKPGFVFRDAGGTEAIYNDYPQVGEYVVDGHRLEITANVVLRPDFYTLGLAGDYERLLRYSDN